MAKYGRTGPRFDANNNALKRGGVVTISRALQKIANAIKGASGLPPRERLLEDVYDDFKPAFDQLWEQNINSLQRKFSGKVGEALLTCFTNQPT